MGSAPFNRIEDFLNDESFCNWVLQAQENPFWEEWPQQHPDLSPVFEAAKSFLENLPQEERASSPQVDNALAAVWGQINAEEAQENIAQPIPLYKKRSNWIRNIAAVLLLLVSLGTFAWYQANSNYSIYETAYGEQKELTLPDGSLVILQANSQLKVSKQWEQSDARKVTLKGQAFFNVQKAKAEFPVKFVVHTKKFDVEVLGTQFDVLNRSAAQRVILQEGKIQMKLAQDKVVPMQPNEMLSLSKSKKGFEKKIVQSQSYTAWTQGKIILDNTSLKEITQILQDHYGYKVTIAKHIQQNTQRSSLAEIPIPTPQDLLNLIASSYEVQVQQEGKKVQIY